MTQVSLQVGTNAITVTVTSTLDQVTSRNYTLNVNRRDQIPAAPAMQRLPVTSPLVPDGLQDGQIFRLLALNNEANSGTAEPGNIAVYNSRVQSNIAAAQPSVAAFSGEFRALISTPQMDARDNTATNRVTASHVDTRIYWVRGDKIADNTADFYDGNWDSQDARLWSGARATGTDGAPVGVWTGSNADGTGDVLFRAGEESVRSGRNLPGEEISGASNYLASDRLSYYALSPRITVVAPLTGLELSPADSLLFPAFDPSIANYQVTHRSGNAIRVRPSATSGSTIRVNGEPVNSGAFSASVAIGLEDTREVPIVVTSSSGLAVTYTLRVTRQSALNADLANLTISDGTLMPAFDPSAANSAYGVSVANSVTEITITPTPATLVSTIHVSGFGGSTPLPGSVTRVLSVGPNTISITVTSSPGRITGTFNTRIYTLTIIRRDPVPAAPLGQTLRRDSPLVPAGMVVGEQFRLLFLNTGARPGRRALSLYNSLVQSAASSGHADIRAFSGQFRALLSTREVDARDNTATTGGGVPIYWLGGAKVADNYADFYDGSWDTRAPRDHNGNTVTIGRTTLTGSNADGSGEFNLWVGGAGNDNIRIGRLDRGAGNEIHSLEVADRNTFHAQYALSPVLTVAIPDTALSALTLNDMISVGALPLTPAFDATITAYTADVTTDIASLTLTPGVRNPNATATVGATFNGVTTVSPVVVASGIASDAIPLQMGTNIIQVVVTATADNLTFSTTYTFTVNRRVIEPAGRRLLAGSSGLVPPGLGVGAPFRLLFVDNLARFRSQGQNASLSHYNDLVIAAAADGHADIRAFSDQFRALASTATVDARNNTATIESNGDVPIYWLGGDKVADHYADFYDRSWDSRAARDRLGNTVTVAGLTILTGSNADGVGPPIGRLGDSMGFGNVTTGLRVGRLDQGEGAEIDSGVVTDTGFRPLYSLSPVLTLEAAGPQPPVVWYPIRDQSASVRVPFHYTFPANTFYDINQDVLTYSATGLPDWLSFDAAAHSVSGTPPPAAFGQPPASITITAADGDPATADVSDTFTLTVNAGPPAAPANVRALAGDGSITVSWDAVTDTGGYPVQEYQARISVPHPTTPNQSSTLLMTSGDPAVTSVTFNNLDNSGVAYFNISVTVLTGPSSSDPRFAVETSLGNSYILTPISATLDPQAFITTWRTNVNNETITIPTNSDYTYDYTVDWGDGNIDSNVTGDILHSYRTSGLHLVSITGTFPHIYFNVSGDRDKIRSVKRWGPTVWSSMERSFAGCTDLTIEGDAGLPDLSEVTSMRGMLEGTSDFDSSIGHWDVSTVTDMSSLFHYARSFNADISEWDVSNVTDMSVMFQSTLLFNADISEWDVSAVTDTNAMFNGARAFNADISGWNVSGVTDMSNMFNGAFAFNSDLSRWDVSAVTNMSDMFNGALVFNQNLGAWDVGTVTTAENMLVDATLSTANYDALLRGWSEVTDGEGALDENVPFHAGNSQFCDSVAKQQLTTAPNSWNITDDGGFAANCPLLPGAFVTTWAVAAGQRLTIPTNSAVGAYDYAVDWGDGTASTAQSGDAGHTYTNAGDYTVTITGDFPQLYINGGAAKSVIRRVQQWGDQKWRSMENSFAGVENFVIAPNAGKPDLSLGPSLHFMFRGASTSSPIGHWDVSMVTDMSQMFQNASRFNEDLSDWDVSSVTDFSRMFNGVPTFDQNLGDWDVSSATDLTDMFHAVTLSRENYDSLLAGWGAIDADEDDLQPDRSFSAGNSIYCNQSAHDVLTNPPNRWTIADAGAETSGNCRLRFAAGVSVADQTYTVGAAITLALPTATGGGVPLIYHLAPLPDGLTLYDTDAAPDTAALLIGAPSAAMPATAVTYTATDANGATATLTFSLAVAARPAFAADAIPASDPAYTATANSVNTLTLPAATGGAGILRYRLTPAASLPAGMAFDPTMRAIVGTPTAETTATVLTYTVTDANFVTATLTFSLAVATELTFGVVNGQPVQANIPNQLYSVTQNVVLTLPTATGGVAPLTYTLTRIGGSPPLAPGLIFFPTGPIIAGAPDVPFGKDPGAHLRYTVTDANGASVMREFFMLVIAAPSFDGVSIPDQFYTAGVAIPPLTLPAAASEGTLVYDLLQPAAANGLSVDLENRILTGTPDTVTDAVTYTYTAFDDNNVSATLTFTVTVLPAPAFDTSTIAAPEASYDFFINHPITPIILPPATGVATLTYTLTPTPDGLIFNPTTRTLSGTPVTRRPDMALTYTVTDGNPQTPHSVSLTFLVEVEQGGITWSGGFVETAANDGSVSGSLVATLTGDTFADPLVENDFDEIRVPSGLTTQVTRTSDNVATITLIGKADSHTDANDEGKVFIGWVDAAFTNLPAANIVNSLFGRGTVDFNDPGPPVFTAAITDQTYPLNAAIPPLTLPIATDGFTPLSYALLPAASLPPGLTFDAENRSIFGMPTRATTATLFYTVTDAGTPPSTAALAFSVTVASPGMPRITGTVRPGFTLSADRSGLADADGLPTDAAAYAWQWQQGTADGADDTYTDLPAATDSTLLLTAAHLGRRIRLVVSYTDNGGNLEEATSAATAVVSADPPGLTLTPASLAVTEGATATYTLALATQPGESVLVAVIDENPDVTTSPAILTFTPENWNTPQPVTVTAHHDADAVNETATLTHTAAAGGYNAVTSTLAVTVHDEDAALVLTPAPLTLTENTTATYSVALAALPAESVTVTVGSDNPDVTAATTLGATPVTLTFTTENWDTPQPVTVTAAQDADAAPDTASLTHTASAAGGNYDAVTATLSVIVTDTDTAGLALTQPTPAVALDEGAATYTYMAALTSPPTTTVTVTTSSDNPDVTTTPAGPDLHRNRLAHRADGHHRGRGRRGRGAGYRHADAHRRRRRIRRRDRGSGRDHHRPRPRRRDADAGQPGGGRRHRRRRVQYCARHPADRYGDGDHHQR